MARYFLLLFLLAVPPAFGQSIPCFPRSDFINGLGKDAKESIVARGVTGNGEKIELFTTRDGATWTLIVYPPSMPGMACPFAAGEGWQPIAFKEWGPSL